MKMKEMMAKVERAIEEHNDRFAGKMRLAWGYANKEEEEFDKQFTGVYRQQEGLIQCFGKDFEIILAFSGDADYPNHCILRTCLGGGRIFFRGEMRGYFTTS